MLHKSYATRLKRLCNFSQFLLQRANNNRLSQRDIRTHCQMQNDWRSVLLKLSAVAVPKSLLGVGPVTALKAGGSLVVTFPLILFKALLLLSKVMSWTQITDNTGLVSAQSNGTVSKWSHGVDVCTQGHLGRLQVSSELDSDGSQQMECFWALTSLWAQSQDHYGLSDRMASINNAALFWNELEVHQTHSCSSPSETKQM